MYNYIIKTFIIIIMESGIYLLSFPNTSRVYVGKSKNISVRYKQHKAAFNASKAAIKLQKAYHTYGMPTLSVIELAEESALDELESKYIEQFNSVENGFNTRKAAAGGHTGLWGDMNGRSKYSNEQIADTLFLLIDEQSLTYPIITARTGVPKTTIVDIANGTGHKWLQNIFPEEYSKLVSLRYRRKTKNYLKAVSPEGIVYQVEHLSRFCKEHRLPTGNISRLLRGKCKAYGGWTAIP